MDESREATSAKTISAVKRWIGLGGMIGGIALVAVCLGDLPGTLGESTVRDRPLSPLATVPGQVAVEQLRLESFGGKVPRYFEENGGQTDAQVRFLSRGDGDIWFFSSDQVVVSTAAGEGRQANLRMELAGADTNAKPVGLEELPGRTNYFIGNDRSHWQTGIAHYAKLLYEDVYPGVDLLYCWNADDRLEYDFIVEPSADPGAIQLRFDGADKLTINESGDLIAGLGQTQIRHKRPLIYQEIDGDRRPVSGTYRIEGQDRVGFQLATYDRTRPLVIDPVLEQSTLLGGSALDREVSITLDNNRNIYLTAASRSADFPVTMGVFDETHDSAPDVTSTVVSKLSPDGSTLLFATFLGGSLADVPRSHGHRIALDNSGNIYVVGHTMSPEFPTTAGAFDETHNGEFDIYFSILDPTGSILLYSTFLGGSARDQRPNLALDAMGDVYIAGMTQSPEIPTTPSAFDTTHNGEIDLYIAKVRPAGNGANDLLYATFLGGQDNDNAPSMTIDDAGVVHIVGETESSDFPTTPGAFSTVHSGGATDGTDPGDDLYVLKFDPNPAGGGAEDLLYSTFFGGSSEDDYNAFAPGIAVDEQGDIYFTGETISRPDGNRLDYPLTQNALDPNPNLELQDGSRLDKVIVARLRPGSRGRIDLIYSSYLGGMGDNELGALALDENGFLYVTGITDAPDFPTLDPVQAANAGGESDGFVSVFADGGRRLLFSTYLGGGGEERHLNVLPHPTGIYVAGETDSADFPTTTGAFDRTPNGDLDVFVSKITDLDFLPPLSHQITGVLDGASFLPFISPGSSVSVFGNFAEVSAETPGVPLETDLNGFSVTFNDIPGALFGVFGEDFGLGFHQANVQVPWDLVLDGNPVQVRVHWVDESGEIWSDPFDVPAGAASPGIFEFPIGSGQAIVTNFKLSAEDDVIAGSFAQPAGAVDPVVGQPVAIGGVITIWLNGLGPVSPAVVTGDIPGAGAPLAETDKTVRVLIGGVEAQIFGKPVLHPTLVALNQINATVSPGTPTGDQVPIIIEVDCGDGNVFRSKEGVTIAVRATP